MQFKMQILKFSWPKPGI